MCGATHQEQVRDVVIHKASFRLLVLSGKRKGCDLSYSSIRVRPVETAKGRVIQFVYTGKEGTRTANYAGRDLERKLDDVLKLPFSNIHVQTTDEDLHVRITKKGKALLSRGAPSNSEAPELMHDRKKEYPLAAEVSDDFLRAIGIKNAGGAVLPSMQSKFRQINGFISIAEPVLRGTERAPIRLVDCGCGSALLTFAFYHFMKNIRKVETQLTGVDRNAELVGKCMALRDRLGWKDLDFRVAEIAAYAPEAPPDIVFSLHACDTATDEAIALGVRWQSHAIIAAPCCQHELHHKLAAVVFDPLLRQGILRERLADLVTDTFRALALTIAGYKVDVVEFVAPEFTPKNLILRAEKCRPPGNAKAMREYIALKEFWGVTPAIESMLADLLDPAG